MHVACASVREIAAALQVGRGTVHRFLLSQKSKEEDLPKLFKSRQPDRSKPLLRSLKFVGQHGTVVYRFARINKSHTGHVL
jgi:hypothetical protein